MYVQKSSVYAKGLGTDITGPLSIRPRDNPSRPVQHELKSTQTRREQITIARVDSRRLIELNSKFDLRIQTAINTYNSLKYQNEIEHRESVSRLLGIDLYV